MRRVLRRPFPRRLGHGEEATLVDHLSELRHRIVISLAAIVPAFIIAFVFHERVMDWLQDPLPSDRRPLVTFGVTEPFTTSVKVSFYVAIGLALPVLLWQLWGFLAPAVERHTQRIVGAFVAFAAALFAAGVAFGYFVVLPAALDFLTNYDDNLYDVQLRASYYYSFASLMLLATGLTFQMPIFILALVRLRVLTATRLRKNRRVGYVAMLVVAILLPTVDPVSLVFEFIPLLFLFELSIWLAVMMERRWLGTMPTAADGA
jgi:sec-independent protein translocase protein TatC